MSRLSFAVLAGSSLLLLSALGGQAGDAPTVEDLVDKLQSKPQAPGAGMAVGPKRRPVKGATS